MNKIIGVLIIVLPLSTLAYATESVVTNDRFINPFYLGINYGFGSTTWGALVPRPARQNSAMSWSVPKNVIEGGAVYGFIAGYEISPFFAVEAAYSHYPRAHITFSEDSFLTADWGPTELVSSTNAYSLIAKVMMQVPKTYWRVYSDAGLAVVHRRDAIYNYHRTTATFGIGGNYIFSKNWMAEFGGTYTAGYGESELDPAEDYMPFLLSFTLRIAYRF